MIALLRLCRNQRASSAAEFALVLPVFLLLLLGTIDVGRYMWNVGQLEKATQMGTRYAVVTDMVASDLFDYSFATSGNIEQGTVVPQSSFPGISCSSNGTAVSCTCLSGGTCAFGTTADATAFNRIVDRMAVLYRGITPGDVTVDYTWSGLGYSGDPNGSDVDPIVTVRVSNQQFKPLTLGTLQNLGLPGTSHSLTMEDGQGSLGN
ncbi:TadE/TadG family type IV pilus assembly protein [Aurantiacibacter rhizosphaerae]|uniref:Pilus assembly protein n=1 Tax=Aurantiacibacter rhizosphaerae TaxID=2691582 RepID=A0A844XGJ1_9SPHN|nr:TadE/TadG family type IV pilus assembly protein [Aurantiacibacter rhizosphaerae]MWV28940.1 pilus assembly protein [Aurantiacibacter rhizosphaerae]